MKLNRFAANLAFLATLGFSAASHAVIQSDIVFMVDESGSMGNVQTNLRNNIGSFATILANGGVDVRFALVGYGNSSVVPRVLTDFTSAANFSTAAQNLVINGATEPGYTATAFSLNAFGGTNLNYRTNAVKNLMIFTDEASNGDTSARGGGTVWTEALVDALLTANNALFNAITRSGAIASYDDLAANHGGQTFDLNGLNTTDQTVVGSFVQTFASAKLQETLNFCQLNPTAPECQSSNVPEPGSLALLGMGLAGLAGLRKKAVC